MVMGEGFGGHGQVGLVVCGGRLFYVWCTYYVHTRYRVACVCSLVCTSCRLGKQDMYYLNSKRDISIQKLNGDFLHAAR